MIKKIFEWNSERTKSKCSTSRRSWYFCICFTFIAKQCVHDAKGVEECTMYLFLHAQEPSTTVYVICLETSPSLPILLSIILTQLQQYKLPLCYCFQTNSREGNLLSYHQSDRYRVWCSNLHYKIYQYPPLAMDSLHCRWCTIPANQTEFNVPRIIDFNKPTIQKFPKHI